MIAPPLWVAAFPLKVTLTSAGLLESLKYNPAAALAEFRLKMTLVILPLLDSLWCMAPPLFPAAFPM